ncbi:MAG: hypothetical protein PWP72_1503 [Thermoanaerobacter sp.]|jgi:hypothetical protein|nr:hypothetical protein [Thermoanaerobacter sp.]
MGVLEINPQETRQKKFLEEVDYDLLLTHYKLF